MRGKVWIAPAFTIALVAGGLVTASCTGPGAEDGCPVVASCGGDPTGTWVSATVCQASVTPPSGIAPPPTALPATANPQNPTEAKPQPVNNVGNWCSELIYLPPDQNNPLTLPDGEVADINLFHGPGAVTGGSFVLGTDHTYSFTVELLNTTSSHFAPVCFDGDTPSCDVFAQELLDFEKSGMPNFQSFDCTSATDGGCDCTYQYAATNSDTGSWQVSGNILYMFSASSKTQPMTATTFCANNGTLSVTGYNGQSLLSTPGLRTVTFTTEPSSGGGM